MSEESSVVGSSLLGDHRGLVSWLATKVALALGLALRRLAGPTWSSGISEVHKKSTWESVGPFLGEKSPRGPLPWELKGPVGSGGQSLVEISAALAIGTATSRGFRGDLEGESSALRLGRSKAWKGLVNLGEHCLGAQMGLEQFSPVSRRRKGLPEF